MTFLQTIIKLNRGNELDKKQIEFVINILFFDVSNRDINIDSLQSIVCNQKNRYFLKFINQYSDLFL